MEELGLQNISPLRFDDEISEFENILNNVVDLVASRDHEELQRFLEHVVNLDLTQVYDERGFSLVHIACQNNDHKTLDVLINGAFTYWESNNQNMRRSLAIDQLKQWVNSTSV